MHCHANSRLTPRARAEVFAAVESGMTVSAACVAHRAIRRLGLSRDAPSPISIVRYEYSTPGGLLHLDTKELGWIGDGPGHRATGDQRGRKHGIGWEVLHVAIDDATRLVYAEILPDEKGRRPLPGQGVEMVPQPRYRRRSSPDR